MQEGHTGSGSPEAHLTDIQKEENEQRLQAMAELGVFRREIINLELRENNPVLHSLDPKMLTVEDMMLYYRYKDGRLTLDDIEKQKMVIRNIEEADDSTKLLYYLHQKLLASRGKLF